MGNTFCQPGPVMVQSRSSKLGSAVACAFTSSCRSLVVIRPARRRLTSRSRFSISRIRPSAVAHVGLAGVRRRAPTTRGCYRTPPAASVRRAHGAACRRTSAARTHRASGHRARPSEPAPRGARPAARWGPPPGRLRAPRGGHGRRPFLDGLFHTVGQHWRVNRSHGDLGFIETDRCAHSPAGTPRYPPTWTPIS